MKKTSQRSLLFRQNVGRTEGEWAHFLDGYRQARFHFGWRLLLGGAEEAGMKGWCERAADIFAKHGEIAAKNEVRPGSPRISIDSPHSPRSATWANTPRRTDGPKLLSIDTTATTRGMRR